ncbi:MAG TPA: GDP-mannose 4,6-dehydratase [Candidatus Limnocylindrales bacterium]|nr:GDP-mannose 4,6-dehydratase [Candidatus Limnocylindrales bacterium]
MLAAVTGAEGFIGSHLVEALVATGARVRAMVLYNSFGSWGWLDGLAPEVMASVEVVLGDVRDPRATREFIGDADVVYHLAALIAIPYSYHAPHSYLETNAGGTMNVLEAVRSLETPRLIHTSTSEVYGTALRVPIDEDHPLQAQSPYSATKVAADKLAESYHAAFAVPVVTLRPFNTYGPRQSARAVIPTIITQLAAGREEVRLGALTPTRDLTHAADTARAFIAAAAAPIDAVAGRVLNAGSGNETSVGELADLIARKMRRPLNLAHDEERTRPDNSEVMRLVSDSSRLRTLTGWEPSYSLDAGLDDTIAWFTRPENLGRYRPEIFNL